MSDTTFSQNKMPDFSQAFTPEDAIKTISRERNEALERALIDLRNRYSATESRLQDLIDTTAHLEEQNRLLLDIDNHGLAPMIIEPAKLHPKSCDKLSAVPISCVSDIHPFERVWPERVQYTNEYTPQICVKRMARLTIKTVNYINFLKQEFKVDAWLVQFLGDVVGNLLRKGDHQTAAGTPMEEVIFMLDILVPYIENVFDNTDISKIYIAGVHGNHDRNTEKIENANFARNSFTWILYHMLRKFIKRNRPDIAEAMQFDICEGDSLITNVLGYPIRAAHGHQFGYQRGVGGPLIPGYRWLAGTNDQENAYMTNVGHHHDIHIGKRLNINGSVIGMAPYASGKGFYGGVPQQSIFTINQKDGLDGWKQLTLDQKWSDMYNPSDVAEHNRESDDARMGSVDDIFKSVGL